METSLNIWWGALFWTAQQLIAGHGIGVNEGSLIVRIKDVKSVMTNLWHAERPLLARE